MRRKEKIQVKCDNCGKPKEVSEWHFKNYKQHYCGVVCSNEGRSRRIEVSCSHCGKATHKKLSVVNSKKTEMTFCSRECCYAFRRLNPKHSPNYKGRESISVFVCQVCGIHFERTERAARRSASKTCSSTCRAEWQSLNYSGENHPSWKGGEPLFACANCGRVVSRSLTEMAQKRTKRVFCCLKCKGEWWSVHQRGENNPNWINTKRQTQCRVCGKTFTTSPYKLRNTAFLCCSNKCKNRYHSRLMWRGGAIYSYGENWTEQRKKARERDNHTCQHCGITRQEHGRNLAVHHIRPFREFGYIRGKNENYLQANELTNLITLCASCHPKAERGKIAL